MKRVISVFALLCIIFSFASCKKEEEATVTKQPVGADAETIEEYYDGFCARLNLEMTKKARNFIRYNSGIFIANYLDFSKYKVVDFDFPSYYEDPEGFEGDIGKFENLTVMSSFVQNNGSKSGILLQLTDGRNGYYVYMFGNYQEIPEGETVSFTALPLCINREEDSVLLAGICFI